MRRFLSWQVQCLIFFPILLFALFFSYQARLEIAWMEFFYDFNAQAWLVKRFPVFVTIYQYGVLPILLVAGFFLNLLLFGFFLAKERSVKPLISYLVMLVGSNLLIEVLKTLITRTRPYDLENFGALYKYMPISWEYYSQDGIHFSSFPSGHAAAGFSLTILAYLFLHRKGTSIFFYLFALALGTLLSLARLFQGGHFLSDLLFSFAFCQIFNSLYYRFCIPAVSKAGTDWIAVLMPSKNFVQFYLPSIGRKALFGVLSLAGWFVLLIAYLVNFYQSLYHQVTLSSSFQEQNQFLPLAAGQKAPIEFRQGFENKAVILYMANAEGFPWETLEPILQIEAEEPPKVLLGIEPGFFSHNFDGFVRVYLPKKPEPLPAKALEDVTASKPKKK